MDLGFCLIVRLLRANYDCGGLIVLDLAILFGWTSANKVIFLIFKPVISVELRCNIIRW